MTDLLYTWVLPLGLGPMLAVVVHELGHTVAGRFAGLGVASVGIGTGRTQAIRVFGCRLYAGEGSLGLTMFVPRQWVIHRWQEAVAGAGGPAANLLATAAFGGVWLTAGGIPWVILGAINFLTACFALYPTVWQSPVGPLESDGRSLLRLRHPRVVPARAVWSARYFDGFRSAIGEPRPFVLWSDLAAIEWTLLGAADAAVRCRAGADAARVAGVSRFERAVDVLTVGVLARVAGDRSAAADRLAEIRLLVPNDSAFLAYAAATLTGLPPADPWFLCWWLRRAAAGEPEPGLAADLYAEAVRAAFAGVPSLGDHADDLAVFADATDQMLLAYRRAVRAAGGDVKLATRELLAPIYAGWRVGVDWPQPALPTPARAKVLNAEGDRRRWRRGAKSLAGLVLAAGGLLGVGLALNVTAYWKVGFGLAAAGGVILFLSLIPILLAAVSLALPPLRPGRADNGRTLLVLARCLWWALVLLAALAVGATLSLPDRP